MIEPPLGSARIAKGSSETGDGYKDDNFDTKCGPGNSCSGERAVVAVHLDLVNGGSLKCLTHMFSVQCASTAVPVGVLNKAWRIERAYTRYSRPPERTVDESFERADA